MNTLVELRLRRKPFIVGYRRHIVRRALCADRVKSDKKGLERFWAEKWKLRIDGSTFGGFGFTFGGTLFDGEANWANFKLELSSLKANIFRTRSVASGVFITS